MACVPSCVPSVEILDIWLVASKILAGSKIGELCRVGYMDTEWRRDNIYCLLSGSTKSAVFCSVLGEEEEGRNIEVS